MQATDAYCQETENIYEQKEETESLRVPFLGKDYTWKHIPLEYFSAHA